MNGDLVVRIGFQRGGREVGKRGKGGCERVEYRWGLGD